MGGPENNCRPTGSAIPQREQGLDVPNRGEEVADRSPDTLGRRIGRDQVRVQFLQRFEFGNQGIELGVGYRRVVSPKAATFAERLVDLADESFQEVDDEVNFDIDGNGIFETSIGQPDFTFLSLRSNVVLRWEYKLGSTLFLVWQHGLQVLKFQAS